jgi:hypothetical protein
LTVDEAGFNHGIDINGELETHGLVIVVVVAVVVEVVVV